MTDNLDGTYTYNYSVSKPGQITVSVLQYTQGGVYREFFFQIYLNQEIINIMELKMYVLLK